MFCFRKNVLVAILLTLIAFPTSATPLPQVDSWMEPVRLFWQSVISFLEDDEAGIDTPSSLTEKSLGWIDPSGLNGDAPTTTPNEGDGNGTGGDGNGEEGGGVADFHGWIDPSGAAAPGTSTSRR